MELSRLLEYQLVVIKLEMLGSLFLKNSFQELRTKLHCSISRLVLLVRVGLGFAAISKAEEQIINFFFFCFILYNSDCKTYNLTNPISKT
jgi:hypothetical protein